MQRFRNKLDFGQIGEGKIAKWLKYKNYSILPVYELEIHTGKGPRLFTPREDLIAPDMFVYNKYKAMWIEAKRKSAFSWHRKTQNWTTGIDLKHYFDYCKIDDESPFKVFLMFLQEGKAAKDSPISPSGLYYNSLSYLRRNEDHRHMNWGKHGMVYWNIDCLKKIAELDELQ